MKRILVTGATSGIGRATALRLATPDTEIIITGRRKERLEALKQEIEAKGATCLALNFDVRSEAECIEYLKPLGRVDILISWLFATNLIRNIEILNLTLKRYGMLHTIDKELSCDTCLINIDVTRVVVTAINNINGILIHNVVQRCAVRY